MDIAHCMFSCKQSSNWLQSQLQPFLPKLTYDEDLHTVMQDILLLLHSGHLMPWCDFAIELSDHMAHDWEINPLDDFSLKYKHEKLLDLSRFESAMVWLSNWI